MRPSASVQARARVRLPLGGCLFVMAIVAMAIPAFFCGMRHGQATPVEQPAPKPAPTQTAGR